MIDFSNIVVPFDGTNLLQVTLQIIGIVGGYLLLSMSFSFAPQIINFIRFAVTGEREKDGYIYGRNGSVIGYRENGKKTVLGNLKRMSRHRD